MYLKEKFLLVAFVPSRWQWFHMPRAEYWAASLDLSMPPPPSTVLLEHHLQHHCLCHLQATVQVSTPETGTRVPVRLTAGAARAGRVVETAHSP